MMNKSIAEKLQIVADAHILVRRAERLGIGVSFKPVIDDSEEWMFHVSGVADLDNGHGADCIAPVESLLDALMIYCISWLDTDICQDNLVRDLVKHLRAKHGTVESLRNIIVLAPAGAIAEG